MSLLELHRLGYRYGAVQAIQNVTLEIEAGTSLGIIGPNGCGKSTLIRLLAALLRPSSGCVIVDGFDTRFEARQARRRIGYVPDELGVYPELSVWQYLAFFAQLSGVPALERKATIETLLRVVDLYEERQAPVQFLSRGMRRRLALARALVHSPTILLLDDPLSGLDSRGRLELIEVIKELADMGTTVIMTSHLLGDVLKLCTHVAVMREGQIVRLASASELAEAPARGRRIELEVLLGEEIARGLLSGAPDVRALEVVGRTLAFEFAGDSTSLATLHQQLVSNGVQIIRFGPAPERLDELAAGLTESSTTLAV